MKRSDLGHIPVWRIALACVRPKWDCVHAQAAIEMNAAVYLSVTSARYPNPRQEVADTPDEFWILWNSWAFRCRV